MAVRRALFIDSISIDAAQNRVAAYIEPGLGRIALLGAYEHVPKVAAGR